MKKYFLVFLPIILIGMTSSVPDQRIESFDLVAGENPHYRVLKGSNNQYLCYNYVHVGQIHERRFVAEGEVFYFLRRFNPMSSTLEVVNENQQPLLHAIVTDEEDKLYIGKSDRYKRVRTNNSLSIYKNDLLILRSNWVRDDLFGNRINLEYSLADPNLKFLKLMALEASVRIMYNEPPVIFKKSPEEEEDESEARRSRY